MASGHTLTEIAEKLGMSQQNLSKLLSVQDVKTGLVEKISKALNVPVSYFFEDKITSSAIASGDYSAASVHGDASVNTSNEMVWSERVKALQKLVDEKERIIEEKERTIKILLDK